MTERLLTQPFFYFSLYLRENRADYYDALQRVRTHGDWEGWLHFYFVGVEAVARQSADTSLALRTLFEGDQQRIMMLGRAVGSTLQLYDHLRQRVIISIPRAAKELEMSWQNVRNALRRLEQLGITREITGRSRDRLYAYHQQLALLDQGTQPPERTQQGGG
jgi:Fic family protein